MDACFPTDTCLCVLRSVQQAPTRLLSEHLKALCKHFVVVVGVRAVPKGLDAGFIIILSP